MTESVYRHGSKYSKALLVTDMFSKFMFGRSLIQGNENGYERVACRLLIEIFGSFGLPGKTSYATIITLDNQIDFRRLLIRLR